MKRIIALSAILIVLVSCKNREFNEFNELVEFINNEKNGFTGVKETQELSYSVTILPTDYLVYSELTKDYSDDFIDSIRQLYQNNLTILLTLTPKNNEVADLLLDASSNYLEYKGIYREMNFHLDSRTYLKAGSTKIKPVLTSFENNYGLKPGKSAILVFSTKDMEYKKNDFDIVFEDMVFYGGVLYFHFNHQNINDQPKLKILQKENNYVKKN